MEILKFIIYLIIVNKNYGIKKLKCFLDIFLNNYFFNYIFNYWFFYCYILNVV